MICQWITSNGCSCLRIFCSQKLSGCVNINAYSFVCVCLYIYMVRLFCNVYICVWVAPFQLEWDSLSSIYVPTTVSIDYISVFGSHEKHENGETYILGSLNAVMCKAMRVKIIRKRREKKLYHENAWTWRCWKYIYIKKRKRTPWRIICKCREFSFYKRSPVSQYPLSHTSFAHANTNTVIQFARIESLIRFNAQRKSTQQS